MRQSLESYMHSCAKRVVVDWLRDTAAQMNRDEWVNCAGIEWRINRRAPHWGIWEEYPVMDDGLGITHVWDEHRDIWEDRPPTYQELLAEGRPPMAILDIAVQHKGGIIAGVEIVHKHDLTKLKSLKLKSANLHTLYRLPASWVLNQVRKPEKIPANFKVW